MPGRGDGVCQARAVSELAQAAAEATVSFDCPRCGAATEARFYGPCDECVTALAARFRGEQRDVEAAAYEPKMNVTPNAVALKD